MKILAKVLLILGIFGTTFSSVFAEIKYTYYYGQGCPHCANVDRYMTGVDGYNKVDIEKKEVYFNKDNALAMSDDMISLNVPDDKGGVPFLIIEDTEKTGSGDTREYLVGDGPIIDYFTPILGEPVPVDNSKRNTVILIVLGILAVIIPLLIIKGGKK